MMTRMRFFTSKASVRLFFAVAFIFVLAVPLLVEAIGVMQNGDILAYLPVIVGQYRSPTGEKLIAFESTRDGDIEIYIMNEDGTGQRNITNAPSSDDKYPAWSPDGTKIAFVSDRDGFPNIYVINADGSQVKQLTNTEAQKSRPAWSPDGSKIAFGSTFIFVMNVDGSDVQQITKPPETGYFPSYSPDGGSIAFYSKRDRIQFEIYSMNADGSNPEKLTSTTQYNIHPAWSPAGTRIAFSAGSPGADPLFIHLMNPDGSDIIQLTTGTAGNRDYSPDWSPDGSKIVFTHCQVEGFCGISVMNSDGSNQVQLTSDVTDGVHNAYPSWQP